MSQRLIQVLISDGDNWYQLWFPQACSWISFEGQEIYGCSLMNCEPWKTNKSFQGKWRWKYIWVSFFFFNAESLEWTIIFMKIWTCIFFRSQACHIITAANFYSKHVFKSEITLWLLPYLLVPVQIWRFCELWRSVNSRNDLKWKVLQIPKIEDGSNFMVRPNQLPKSGDGHSLCASRVEHQTLNYLHHTYPSNIWFLTKT